ncbi:MAG: hypothetical protein OXE99_15265 [Cellvibrionales bacterium]|nr:hypothetical protein [Cellvibrionales bacterium]
MAEHFSFHSDRAGISLIDFLGEETALSKSKLKKVIGIGGLWVKPREGELERVYQFNKNIKLGDDVHLFYDEQLLKIPKASLDLIQDEGRYAVYFKSDRFALEESPYCDHLHMSRSIERDLPEDREIFSILSDEPVVAGFTLFTFHPTMADKFDKALNNQQIIGEFSCHLSSDEWLKAESVLSDLAGNATDKIQLSFDALPERIDRLLDAGLEPSQPFLVCEKISFPCPFTGQLITIK